MMVRVLVCLGILLALPDSQAKPPGRPIREMFAPDLYDIGIPAGIAKQTGQFPGKGSSKRNEVLEGLFDEFPGAVFYKQQFLVLEGDILIAEVDGEGNVQHGQGHGNDKSLLSVGLKHSGNAAHLQFWDHNPVPYVIEAQNPYAIQHALDAIAHWEDKTEWRFEVRSNQNSYINFIDASGCASWVGQQYGEQTIWLAPNCGFGAAVHEIGHALGFWHEQSRANRDDYITILTENIMDGYGHNFEVKPDQEVYTAYDYTSIMHYPRTAFSKNGEDTIKTTSSFTQNMIGNRDGLSYSDIISAEGRRRAIAGCTGDGSDYRAFVDTTKDGFTCQMWDVQSPHGHSYTPDAYPTSDLVENWCRNPDGGPGGVWCFTTDSNVRWGYCDVQCGYPDLRIKMGANQGKLTHLIGLYVHTGLRNGKDYYVRGTGCQQKYLVYSGSEWQFSDSLTGTGVAISKPTTEDDPTKLSLYPHLWNSDVHVFIYSPSDCNAYNHDYLGDGFCEYEYAYYNTLECGWDGGDCCSQTCQPTPDHDCTNGFDCVDTYYQASADFQGTATGVFGGGDSKTDAFRAKDDTKGFNQGAFMDNSDKAFATFPSISTSVFGEGKRIVNEPEPVVLTSGFLVGAAVTTLGFTAGVAVVILKRRKYVRVLTRNVCDV